MVNINLLKTDNDWTFADVKKGKTLYATHGYHHYPAKFIPQIVRKAIDAYSCINDIILDPFGGCGTTSVESQLKERNSVGVDVNDVAVLISRAKTKLINSKSLKKKNDIILTKIKNSADTRNYYNSANSRLIYWFNKKEYNKLKIIYKYIEREKNKDIKLFYRCCFSNILKKCSIWYSKSIKPMRDLNKKILDPFRAFEKHLYYMTEKNKEYGDILKLQKQQSVRTRILKGDARCLPLPANYVDLIITSPPYVTSYEYADLHQLSTLWFGFAHNISTIKKHFIGTSSRTRARKSINSSIAMNTINKLYSKNKRLARNISNYYYDLSQCYKEMHRVLKPNHRMCLILGNTEYVGVKIPNIEVTEELLENLNCTIEKVIKRKLSSKIFTPYRNKQTGKFASASEQNKKKIYQYEYIIVAKRKASPCLT